MTSTSVWREGIKPHSYYAWTKEFMEAGKERLTRDAVRDATQQEVHQLKERERRAEAAGGRSVTGGVPSQKTAIPMPQDNAGTRG